MNQQKNHENKNQRRNQAKREAKREAMLGRSVWRGLAIAAIMLGVSSASAAVSTPGEQTGRDGMVGVVESGSVGLMIEAPKKSSPKSSGAKSSSKSSSQSSSAKRAPSRSKTKAKSASRSGAKRSSAKQPTRKAAPKPKAQPKPKAKPNTRPKAKPAPKPKAQPKAKPKTRPSTKPATRPSTRPSVQPSTRPSSKPSVRPNTRPKTTTNRPTTSKKSVTSNNSGRRPTTSLPRTNTPKTNPGAGPTQSLGSNTEPMTGPVTQGVQKMTPGVSRLTPVVKADEAPRGFDLDRVKQSYLSRTRNGGTSKSVGSKMDELDEGGSPGDGAHDDGYHDDGHDDHGDHHGDHHDDDWSVHIDINFYSDNDHCPSGWWYIYGDYNGDGYTDYVCTNGYRSVYWYGWGGSYWGASPWYGWYGGGYNYGYGSGYGSGYNNGYSDGYSWWYNSVSERYRGTVDGGVDDELVTDPSYSTTPNEPDAMPEAMPLSALEVARLEMSLGEPEIAIDAYRAHLSSYSDDWNAVRELGLAMLRVGDRGDGIALISYAYSMDPELARWAVPVSLFSDSERILRDVVISTVGWGHRNPSSSVWLTVAVLMQGEGRDGPALRMIERAYEHGLAPDVGSVMETVLSHR